MSALAKYFPFGLSVRDLTEEVDNSSETLSAAPMRMLSTLLKMNVEGRDCLDHIDREPELPRRRRGGRTNPLLSPQDLFMVAFQSCDAYLQQLLAEKMFQGKLAVPFLLPSPTSKNTNIITSWPLRSTMIE